MNTSKKPGGIEPCAMLADEAAAFLGMSRHEWDRKWKAGDAPQPARNPGKGSRGRWSRDELRAWQAHGCPTLERWRPIWQRMLESGTWCPTRLIPGGDHAA